MPDRKQRAMKVSAENGASSWFSTLPIADHGFALSALRSLQRCPLTVLWLKSTSSTISLCLWPRLTIEHALSCSRGRVQSIRHNEIRDMTVDLMSEVCYGVSIELCLQAVTEEQLMHKSLNRNDGAHLDIVAKTFCGRDRQCTFFDVQIFNPFAQSHLNMPLAQCYWKQEKEKKRAHEVWIREVENRLFSPLVFTTAGGMEAAATVVYQLKGWLHMLWRNMASRMDRQCTG